MADNNVVITFTFNAEGQSGVLSAVDAINDRIKQGQEAQAREAESGPTATGVIPGAAQPISEHVTTGAQSHLPDPKEAKEFGASIETANRSLEVLVRGVESFGRILTTGRLNVAVGGFNQIGESVKGVAERFGEAGAKIGFMATAVTAAIAGFGAGAVVIKELGEHAAEAVNGFQELAAVAGLSSEKFAALQANFAQFGVGMETVQRLVRLTSVRIQEEWGSLVHAQRTAADDSIKLNLDVNEAQRREQEAQSQARLAPFGEVEAQERLEEARAQERLAPLGVLRAEESVQESQARQRFGPHGIAHAEANLEEAQLAIPEGELTTEGAKTSLLQAQLNYNKIFGTVDHPVQEKHFTPGSNEDLAYQIQHRQAEEGLKQAQFQEKSAEIKERETKSVEGGIPEAEEALRKAHFQERVAPLETEEAQEGLRKAQFQQEEAAPHAVMEADEGLLKAKREEVAASDEVAKAAIGVRAAFLALTEFPLKNAPALAAAIGNGGAGIPWAQVGGADIFRALILRGVNPATGVPDLQGVLKQVTQFYNLPGVPQAAKADLGAEITGGRGTGLAQVIAALTEQNKNKEGIFEETDRSRGLAASMDAQKAASEEFRATAANADIDKTKAVVDVGKKTIPLAGDEERLIAAGITSAAGKALQAYDDLAAGAHAVVSAGEGVISTFNKIAEFGARLTPEYKAALAAHPEVQEAISNEAEAKKSVTDYAEQKLSSANGGSWEQRFHALQTDPQYQALQAKASQASETSETLQHNLAVQTVPSLEPKVEGLNVSAGGELKAAGDELKGAGSDLRLAATQIENTATNDLRGAAEELKGAARALQTAATPAPKEGHSTGGYITGPGTGTSDSIRAPWLSNGEYVIKAARVAQVGKDKLDDFNAGHVGFADGGPVDDATFDPYSPRNKAELKPYTPSWSERLRATVQDTMSSLGASKTFSQDFGHNVQDVAGFVPGVGQLLAGNEAVRDYKSGNYLGAVINAAGALPLPGIGAAEKGVAKEVEKGIVAYHGSPHDFDKFSTANIGTGEGAQAYGHGLYFAENENVARDYRNSLAPGFADRQGAPLPTPIKNALEFVRPEFKKSGDYAGGIQDAIKRLGVQADFYRKEYGQGTNLYDNAVERLKAVNPDDLAPAGHMYQVRINAEPEHFLDWDKPLSEQHPKVQDAYNARVSPGLTTREIGNNPNPGPMFDVIHPSGGTIGTFTKDNLQDVLSNPAKYVPTSGKDFYEELERHYGRGSLTAGKKDATDVLHEAGIPGIKYLDQGSRVTSGGKLVGVEQTENGWQAKVKVSNRGGIGFSAPTDMFTTSKPYATEAEARQWADEKINTGSRNYVVFDDKLVNIENKYALGGLVNYADGGSVDEDYHRLRRWHKAHHKPIEHIQVPHDRRTDAQIRANYADNLNVELEGAPTGEAHNEEDARRLGLIASSPSRTGESRWAQAIPEEDRPRFARALDADRRAEARRALGLSPPPLGDAAGGSMPWGTITHEYQGEHDARERRARGDFQTDAQFTASPAYEGRATGGFIQGPGTGTSDSIPWVSNGEYVIKADRVTQVGVDKMHDFNEGRIGFAAGGYIPAVNGMVPSPFTGPTPPSGGFLLQAVSQIGQEKAAFASGAMLGNSSPLMASNLVGSSSPSSSAFSGHYTLDVTTDKGVVPVMMTEDMMLSLSQSALASKLTRTGITPTWGS